MGEWIRCDPVFVIRPATKEVKIVGIVGEPNDDWMEHTASIVTDCIDEFLKNHRNLIHDRGTQFTSAFKTILCPRRYSALAPPSERRVVPAEALCTNRMIFFEEGGLRGTLNELELFDRRARPHLSIGNKVLLSNEHCLASRGVIGFPSRQGG